MLLGIVRCAGVELMVHRLSLPYGRQHRAQPPPSGGRLPRAALPCPAAPGTLRSKGRARPPGQPCAAAGSRAWQGCVGAPAPPGAAPEPPVLPCPSRSTALGFFRSEKKQKTTPVELHFPRGLESKTPGSEPGAGPRPRQ